MQALGVTGIWLMPVTESADNDHGNAVEDYRDIETDYGSMPDFEQLLAEAHARGIAIIIDYNPRNPDVVDFHKNNLRFWLNKGVDGFRFDAVGVQTALLDSVRSGVVDSRLATHLASALADRMPLFLSNHDSFAGARPACGLPGNREWHFVIAVTGWRPGSIAVPVARHRNCNDRHKLQRPGANPASNHGRRGKFHGRICGVRYDCCRRVRRTRHRRASAERCRLSPRTLILSRYRVALPV